MIRSVSICMLALALTACHGARRAEPDLTPAPTPSTMPASLLPADGASLFPLRVALTDQDGKPLALDDFAGHPLIISMFYGTCPYACPMLISEIKKIEQKLDPATRERTRVLLVSFDPERDTTSALSELVVRHKVDAKRWHMARASDADVRQLAAVLGIRYRRLDNGQYNHSSVITVLDGHGVPRFREDGLGDPPDLAATALETVAGAPRGLGHS